jgi:hypothetical protein
VLGCEVCGVIVYVEDDDQLQGGNDPNKMEDVNDSGVHHTLFLVRVPKSM